MADTNERELAEQRYVELAHDYEKNPIGSRDWVIFWNGWRERSELKATPLPADAALIGKLRHQLAQATDEAARLRALSQPAELVFADNGIDIASPDLSDYVLQWQITDGTIMTVTSVKVSSEGLAHTLGVIDRLRDVLPLSAAPSAKGGAT